MKIDGMKYEAVEKEISEFIKNPINKGGSHIYYISKIKKLLKVKGKTDKIKDFNQILALKEYREKSDYKPVAVTVDDSNSATDLSKKINDLLKKEFSL